MAFRVRLTLEPDGAVCLESPYDRGFVEGLKLAIDWGGRSWDAARKRWIVSALYADVLVQYLRTVGAQIQDDRAPAPVAPGPLAPLPPMPADLREAFETLHLAYTAPLCVAESSYKALVKFYHPDMGGEVALFHEVNDAIQIVRRYLDPKPAAVDEPNDDIPF